MTDLPPALRPLCARPAEAALFVDFDGTVAPIVEDPATARPLPGVPVVLGALAARLGLVAVVSGRPAAFIVDALGHLPGVRLAGLYGMEEVADDGEIRVSPDAERWRPAVVEAIGAAVTDAPAGAEVEPKGLSVTLHWRRAPEAEAWARDLAARLRARTGLVPHPGRMSLELRPPLATDKGSVVRRLAAGHAAVACFGDDLGDLPAFAALDELAADGVAVARVAVVDPETPPEVAEAADVVVAGPEGALSLLGALLEAVGGA